jgi:hypothetical protein
MKFERDPREREENIVLCIIGAAMFVALLILYSFGDW